MSRQAPDRPERTLEQLARFEYDMGGTCMDMGGDHEIVSVDEILGDYQAHANRLRDALGRILDEFVNPVSGYDYDDPVVRIAHAAYHAPSGR